jgi:transglutaminase-like putative cysteine protease
MHHQTLHRISLSLAIAVLLTGQLWAKDSATSDDAKIKNLIDLGKYAEAEKLLSAQIDDPEAPVTSGPAVQLEVLRRTRHDFPHTKDDVLAEIKKTVPDATAEDVKKWSDSGDLQFRIIDGEPRYFSRAVGNLFRFNKLAKARQVRKEPEKSFNTTAMVEKLVKLSETTDDVEIYPVKHHLTYTITIHKDAPHLTPGATVRAWLPYPQEYRQQRDIKLLSSSPSDPKIASTSAPQRTAYFEQKITDPNAPPRFQIEIEFVTSAYCPKLDPAKVKPYDETSDLYREFTAERRPHIAFTPEIKQLSKEIVGDETNPLEKALKIFRWTSKNVPWCAEMEYSIIPSLSVKGLTARRGDCGVIGTSFTTLCRAAGIPARWQSGWQTKPGDWNMHDWAEIYIEPWGWLPVDASHGVRPSSDPRVRDFYCGHMDPYRFIVNLDYGRALEPPKTSFRSEPTDFQRGEIEIDGHNLYFDQWDYKFDLDTKPLVDEKK